MSFLKTISPLQEANRALCQASATEIRQKEQEFLLKVGKAAAFLTAFGQNVEWECKADLVDKTILVLKRYIALSNFCENKEQDLDPYKSKLEDLQSNRYPHNAWHSVQKMLSNREKSGISNTLLVAASKCATAFEELKKIIQETEGKTVSPNDSKLIHALQQFGTSYSGFQTAELSELCKKLEDRIQTIKAELIKTVSREENLVKTPAEFLSTDSDLSE